MPRKPGSFGDAALSALSVNEEKEKLRNELKLKEEALKRKSRSVKEKFNTSRVSATMSVASTVFSALGVEMYTSLQSACKNPANIRRLNNSGSFDVLFDDDKKILLAIADFYACFDQLYMLLKSGSTLQQAINEIAHVQTNAKLGQALRNISRNLSAGVATGAAFKKEGVFPRLVAPTIESGDRAGRLSDTFLRLSELMWLQHNLYSKVKNALFIPKIAAVLMAIMTIAYIKIAIPEYVKLYKETGIPLPWIVSFVSGCVNGIVDYWFITLPVLCCLYKAWEWFSSNNVGIVDSWKLRLPIYNKLHFFFVQHQLASVLNLMLSSGLTLTDSLAQAGKVVDNSIVSNAVGKVREDIIKGNTLSDSMQHYNHGDTPVFDNMLLASINAGEKSNHITLALEHDCKYYERLLNNMIEPTSTKITLLVMLPMGLLIVLMFMFTLVPMFDYMSRISNV